MPGTTFLPVAGPLSTLLAIMISAVIMLVIGYNYSYLMGKNPGIGGVYAYTKGVLGQGHAFLSAWFLCLSYLALIPQNATALAVIPIIAMTANAFKEDELAARDAGMQGHIAKPLDIGKMMATISEVLSKARQK